MWGRPPSAVQRSRSRAPLAGAGRNFHARPVDILNGMNITPADLSHSEMYGLLLNSVAPRPIAWVSTLSASGQPNLAPFSFFNCVCVDPPLLAFAPGLRTPRDVNSIHGEPK